jgi:chromosome segregation ATPase
LRPAADRPRHGAPAAQSHLVLQHGDCLRVLQQIDRDTVRLRRTVTVKTDNYKLDSKQVVKSEVRSMLEAAGFSRANPYNIVKQGKVVEMSNMSDEKRLGTLKDVGGAALYENKRNESEKELAAQQEHIASIDTDVRASSAT